MIGLCFADIWSSREIDIWTRCEVFVSHHISHCCSRLSILRICSQKTNGWFSPLGNFNNGCCHCIHLICEYFLFYSLL